MNSKSFFKAVLFTGLIAGALDFSGAIISGWIVNGSFPTRILETIAGGAFGPEARNGGLLMKFWGLLFHFSTALIFTFFYFLIYPKIKFLQENIFVSALVYGLFVWAVMNMIVLPLSAYHTPIIPKNYVAAARGAFVLIICIGLPVAISARSYYNKTKQPTT